MPLSVLTTHPFSLVAGNEIIAKFAAHNAVGWGPISDPTADGALIQSTPLKMFTPERDSRTTTAVIYINWEPQVVPENGYSDILSYNLQWDRGSEGKTWYNLLGYDTDLLVTSYETVNQLTKGKFYRFKVRSKNYFGWSAFSDILYVKTATWPEIGTAVSTTIDAATGGIIVNWL